METFEWKKYVNGKKDFWIFAILITISRGLEFFFIGTEFWFQNVLEAILCFLLYQGYMWVWYFDVAKIAYNFIRAIIALVVTIPELYWLIHTQPPLQIFVGGLEIAIIVVMSVILIVKKDLKYFVKTQHLKRKGKLNSQILREIENNKNKGS